MIQRRLTSLSEIDMRNMRLFRRIVDAGGLSLAAQAFGHEKSTFSRALKALEGRLAADLCVRGPQGFALTEYGREVYETSMFLDDALSVARARLNHAKRIITGKLTLGISDNLISNMDAKLSDALEVLFKLAPDVQVIVAIRPPDQLAEALASGEVDLAIIAEQHLDPGLQMTPLFYEHYRLFGAVPDGHKTPIPYHDLVRHNIGVIQRTFTRPGVSAQSLKLVGAWTVKASGLEAVATLINTGRCVGFLPTHYMRAIPMRRPIMEVPGAETLRHDLLSGAATKRSTSRSLQVQMLLDILKSKMDPRTVHAAE
jgi:LysR family transcriptional regulator, transcriptional activator for bauABCD operon